MIRTPGAAYKQSNVSVDNTDVARLNANEFLFVSQSSNMTGSSPLVFNLQVPAGKNSLLTELKFVSLNSAANITVTSAQISSSLVSTSASLFSGTSVSAVNTNQALSSTTGTALKDNPTFLAAGIPITARYNAGVLVTGPYTSSYNNVWTGYSRSGSMVLDGSPNIILKSGNTYEIKVTDQSRVLQTYYMSVRYLEDV